MLSVVPLEPFSVSADPVPDFVLVFRFLLILGGSGEALWLSSLSPPFCVISLVGHVCSPVEIFIFSRVFSFSVRTCPSSRGWTEVPYAPTGPRSVLSMRPETIGF